VWLCTCGHEQIYCGPQDSDGSPGSVILCDAEDTYFYSLYNSTIKRLGGGYFMTEFGAMANNSRGIDNMRYLTGQADRHLSSWTYWQFKGTSPLSFSLLTSSALLLMFHISPRLQRLHHVVAAHGRIVLRCRGRAGGQQGRPLPDTTE